MNKVGDSLPKVRMICLGDSLPISANDKVRERVDEYLLFSAFRDIYLWGTKIEKCGTVFVSFR